MARELYALFTPASFLTPNNPGPSAAYVQALNLANLNALLDLAPLTRTEQATINMTFAHCKHHFLSMRNIKRACFTILDSTINDAFKVLNDPAIQGWHAGMSMMFILDQLFQLYGQPTPAMLKLNNTVFCGLYLAADAPEVLF
jgi:hypothetical protein